MWHPSDSHRVSKHSGGNLGTHTDTHDYMDTYPGSRGSSCGTSEAVQGQHGSPHLDRRARLRWAPTKTPSHCHLLTCAPPMCTGKDGQPASDSHNGLTVPLSPEPSHPIITAGGFSQAGVGPYLDFGVSLNRDTREVYPTTPSILTCPLSQVCSSIAPCNSLVDIGIRDPSVGVPTPA